MSLIPQQEPELEKNVKNLLELDTENVEEMKKKFFIDIYDPFVFDDIRRKDYKVRGGFKTEELIHDLMKICAILDTASSPFLFKIWDQDSHICKIVQVSNCMMKDKLSELVFKIGRKKYTALEIMDSGTNMKFFRYNQTTFYSENPLYFSRFRGLPFKKLDACDPKVIEFFISHALNIICNGEKDICRYVFNWIAFLLQRPGEKIGTALILIGDHGVGKTLFTNVICKLCGCYGLENANLKNIAGNYNALVQDKILIVVNEIDAKYGLSSDSANNLKTLITEKSVDINRKHKDAFTGKNVANFIFVSNDFTPIRIEPGDRRYCVLEVSPRFKDDHEYFIHLFDTFDEPDFYENLLTFFLKINIKNWRPDATLPLTPAKARIIEECQNNTKVRRALTKDDLKKGVGRQELFECYKFWAQSKNKEVQNQREFAKIIKERFDIGYAHGQRLYKLKDKNSEQEPSPSPPLLDFDTPPSPPPPPEVLFRNFEQEEPTQEQKYEEEEEFPFQEDFESQNQNDDDDDDNHNDDNNNDDDDDEIFF